MTKTEEDLEACIFHLTEMASGIPKFDTDRGDDGGLVDNGVRAEWGAIIAETARDLLNHPTKDEPDELVSDAICDLMHFLHREGGDVLEAVRMAIANFTYESNMEGDEDE